MEMNCITKAGGAVWEFCHFRMCVLLAFFTARSSINVMCVKNLVEADLILHFMYVPSSLSSAFQSHIGVFWWRDTELGQPTHYCCSPGQHFSMCLFSRRHRDNTRSQSCISRCLVPCGFPEGRRQQAFHWYPGNKMGMLLSGLYVWSASLKKNILD